MLNKIIAVLIVVVILYLTMGLRPMLAQKAQSDSSISLEYLGRLEEKIDRILIAHQEEANKEILSKLEQVLNNQNSILKELEIIKVRSTRR